MNYIGIQAQQSRNNIKTVLLLLMFPALILALTYAFLYLTSNDQEIPYESTTDRFIQIAPLIMTGIAVWFLIAYLFNTYIINSATNSHPLERRDNKRIYNLVENLCMANGMDMPKINVIEDDSLNAFASGINKKSYTVTLTRGIINRLNDEELEGVIAHELTHIRNKDVRLLIVSIVFVGIFTFISQMASRMAYYNSWSSNKDKNGGNGAAVMMLIIALLAMIGYFFSLLLRFAISRKREYMADAGAAQMTRNPVALASALRKISGNPTVSSVKRDDIAQLFIEHPAQGGFSGLFATHPPIEKRINILEQF